MSFGMALLSGCWCSCIRQLRSIFTSFQAAPQLCRPRLQRPSSTSHTAGTETSHALDSTSSDVCKLCRLMDSTAEGGQSQNSPNKDSGFRMPNSTVMLIGVSVDVAIIVVLSWAAQLVQLGVTSTTLDSDNIIFVLGESLARQNRACMSSVLLCWRLGCSGWCMRELTSGSISLPCIHLHTLQACGSIMC